MKYSITLTFQRTQVIEVEANSPEEAEEIVHSGEFEDSQIVDTEDDYVEVSEATLVKE